MDFFEEADKRLADAKAQVSKFTPRAQRVLQLAHDEAKQLNDPFIGTEHLLAGLLGLGTGVAVNVLLAHGFTIAGIQEEIRRLGTSSKPVSHEKIPFTPRTRKVLAWSKKEAEMLGHNYIGTEHILLGLFAEKEGPAADIFRKLNFDAAEAFRELREEIRLKPR